MGKLPCIARNSHLPNTLALVVVFSFLHAARLLTIAINNKAFFMFDNIEWRYFILTYSHTMPSATDVPINRVSVLNLMGSAFSELLKIIVPVL